MKWFFLFFLLIFFGCEYESGGESVSPEMVTIKIGQSGKKFLQENSLPEESSVQRQPAGLNFYRNRWPTHDRGKVKLEHGEHGFALDDVISIQCVEDQDDPDRGIYSCSINLGFAGGGEVLHEAVKDDFYSFIDKLIALGWRSWNQHDLPRLKGREAFSYLLEGGTYIAPLGYKPTLEEWMALKSPSWELYVDGIHLGIRFRRDRTRMDSNSPGAYLFTVSLETAEQRMKSYFSPEGRDNWRELLDDRLESLSRRRAKQEAVLEDRGYTVDSDYQDPEL